MCSETACCLLSIQNHGEWQVSKASEYSVGLQLSGHTHGGQVFPYHVLAYLDQVILHQAQGEPAMAITLSVDDTVTTHLRTPAVCACLP